ncbi:UNKNOWN [Stylonychia lemnae]|uniref:Uncharacterized protein n=1 Tax=Stylonychia lemnae TaxID=5949 RepID=A0A078AR05_STYLE|nr:UNKNOWN [Stylonychia lemnae]|eukprot:CDW84654.1 UNKNOWN [Stylonychia lemnae]
MSPCPSESNLNETSVDLYENFGSQMDDKRSFQLQQYPSYVDSVRYSIGTVYLKNVSASKELSFDKQRPQWKQSMIDQNSMRVTLCEDSRSLPISRSILSSGTISESINNQTDSISQYYRTVLSQKYQKKHISVTQAHNSLENSLERKPQLLAKAQLEWQQRSLESQRLYAQMVKQQEGKQKIPNMIKLLIEKNYKALSAVENFEELNKKDQLGHSLLDMIILYGESLHNKKVMLKYFLDKGASIRSRHIQMLIADQDQDQQLIFRLLCSAHYKKKIKLLKDFIKNELPALDFRDIDIKIERSNIIKAFVGVKFDRIQIRRIFTQQSQDLSILYSKNNSKILEIYIQQETQQITVIDYIKKQQMNLLESMDIQFIKELMEKFDISNRSVRKSMMKTQKKCSIQYYKDFKLYYSQLRNHIKECQLYSDYINQPFKQFVAQHLDREFTCSFLQKGEQEITKDEFKLFQSMVKHGLIFLYGFNFDQKQITKELFKNYLKQLEWCEFQFVKEITISQFFKVKIDFVSNKTQSNLEGQLQAQINHDRAKFKEMLNIFTISNGLKNDLFNIHLNYIFNI